MIARSAAALRLAAAARDRSAALARRTRVPAPSTSCSPASWSASSPAIEAIRLPPDVVFYGFLPPLLYAAAFLTAPREVRENWLSILLLAFGLTAATLFAVGGVAWAFVAALGAGGAFLLGAVLGPTDPVSATSVIGATSAPERLRTILEGESLVNDGVGLVAFSIALTAVERGTFSVADGVAEVRAALARRRRVRNRRSRFVVERLRRRIHDFADRDRRLASSRPYRRVHPGRAAARLGHPRHGRLRRLPRLALGRDLPARGAAPVGRVLGRASRSCSARCSSCSSGRSFAPSSHGLGGYSAWTLARDALLVFGVVVVVRLVWMFTVPHLVSVSTRRGWTDIDPWHDRFVLGWSGHARRALARRRALDSRDRRASRRDPLPHVHDDPRGLVVLAVPLPWLLDRLGFGVADGDEPRLESRLKVTQAALRPPRRARGRAVGRLIRPDEPAPPLREQERAAALPREGAARRRRASSPAPRAPRCRARGAPAPGARRRAHGGGRAADRAAVSISRSRPSDYPALISATPASATATPASCGRAMRSASRTRASTTITIG